MQRKLLRCLISTVFIISVLLAACSPQPALTAIPTATSTEPPKTSAWYAAHKVWPTLTPSPVPPVSDIEKAIRSYHSILMLEHSVDMLSTLIVKIDAREIPLGDPTPRYPYTNAFNVAMDYYNKTDPPPSVLNTSWKWVSVILQQYLNVYNALNEGKAIAKHDVVNMRSFRQLMTNFHNYAEAYLKQSGLDQNFFSSQQQAVEDHFKEAYGNQTMPDLTESGSNDQFSVDLPPFFVPHR